MSRKKIRSLLGIFLVILLFCSCKQENQQVLELGQGHISKEEPQKIIVKEEQIEKENKEISFLSQEEKYKEAFAEIEKQLISDAEKGLPGGVLLVSKEGKLCFYQAFGDAKRYQGKVLLESPQKMEKETMFDLASLTKSYACALGVMKLEEEKLLSYKDKVSTYLPAFKREDKKDITIKDLLLHQSGLKASLPFYRDGENNGDKTLLKIAESSFLELKIGETIYSDLGYMVLGKVIENCTQMDLDTYLKKEIYLPLELSHITYRPLDFGFSKEDCAATERMGNTRDGQYIWEGVRTDTLQGEVHDELCFYCMEGVSGHAGLFSNGINLLKLNQSLLERWKYDRGDFPISQKILKEYTGENKEVKRYTMGFDYAKNEKNRYRYGKWVSDSAFGKTGWTGTLCLVDPQYDLVVVLLTNKRHSPCQGEQFEGAQLDTGKYYPIVEMIYEALGLIGEN